MTKIFFAFRQLRKSLGFTITVIFTIALGIGANTAIFTLVHAILLRSLPVVNPKMLYRVGMDNSQGGVGDGLPTDGKISMFSFELYKFFRDTTPSFDKLAAVQSGTERMNVRVAGQLPKAEITEYVSGNYFETLGLHSFAGRVLSSQDDTPSSVPVAVMSYSTWQSEFGSDPQVVGCTLTFQTHPVTVVGIAPAGFYGDRVSTKPPAFWLPLSLEATLEGSFSILHSPTSNWLYLLGRVKPQTSVEVVSQSMTAKLKSWLAMQPNYLRNGGAAIIARQEIVLAPGGGGIRQMQQQEGIGLYLLMAISGLVLLVACVNVANLMLARGSAQRGDVSLRMALGAARTRIIRQMLTQSLLLACMGGAAGLAFAYAGTRVILSTAFPDAPQLPIDATPSLSVLSFAFLLSLITGVLFGVVPAWATSHAEPAEALRGINRSTKDRGSFSQKSMVVFQVALSLILLVGASLLTRSLANLQEQDLGIQTSDRYILHIDPAGAGYTDATLLAFNTALQARLEAIPGVVHAGLALYSPLEGQEWSRSISVAGRIVPGNVADSGADFDRVNPQFFAAVGERLVRGRVFSVEDTENSQNVAVVNESFAKRFFPGEDPIGRSFGAAMARQDTHRVVGVVADAKFVHPTQATSPMYFLPLTQSLKGLSAGEAATQSRGMYVGAIVLQFQSRPSNVDALVRRALSEVNPNLAVNDLQTLEYQVEGNFNENRLITRLAMLFGCLALILAAVGLYGITSYQVARRTSEIGVRMALGADRGDVLRMVMLGAFQKLGFGLVLGIPGAILGAKSIASQLYGVKAFDPASLGIAVAALAIAAGVAASLPAYRAASIEPVNALRSE